MNAKSTPAADHDTGRPGDRSGSGAHSLWQHMANDTRRKEMSGTHGVSPPAPIRSDFTVLVVDDNEAARYALARTLRSVGYRTLEASGGAEALALASRAAVVLLDVHLPDLHGHEVCRLLKRNAATAAVPIIHVSAIYTDAQHKEAGTDAGADGYLVAPVPPDDLVHAVDLLISRSAHHAAAGG